MNLLIKCVLAVIIILAVHFFSKTNNFYIAGLILGCPALSILAYYFMYMEQGKEKVRITASFALLSVIPFIAFLVSFNILLRRNSIVLSLISASAIWLITSILILLVWNKVL